MVMINSTIETNLQNISNLANTMNIKNFYIFSIVACETLEFEITSVQEPCNVHYVEIGLKYFVEKYLPNPENIKFWEHNRDTLYILRDGVYSDIQELFVKIQDINVKLVRGASQKSHMVSPVDFRLSCYLMILFNMDSDKFMKNNSFNLLTKDKYLPSFR
jgi:hypothetical protein